MIHKINGQGYETKITKRCLKQLFIFLQCTGICNGIAHYYCTLLIKMYLLAISKVLWPMHVPATPCCISLDYWLLCNRHIYHSCMDQDYIRIHSLHASHQTD